MPRLQSTPLATALIAAGALLAACGTDRATPRSVDAPASAPAAAASAAASTPRAEGSATASATPAPSTAAAARPAPTHRYVTATYALPPGTGPHDVAPAADGTVWYTGQRSGELGRLDPRTGLVQRIPLGRGSASHGVIVGPDGAAWVTDGGLNAIVRVTAAGEVQTYPLPANRPGANLNTATFDGRGRLWFTGQSGVYGVLDPRSAAANGGMQVFDAPRGAGPYGIATTPAGEVYYASFAGSYLGRVDLDRLTVTPLDPPTARQGARRVWADSGGRLWISEWFGARVGRYEPDGGRWQEWRLPGNGPQPYAVYVDERDIVWLSDFGANALVWFDPRTEAFGSIPLPRPNAAVRQLLGRPGEVWGAMSGGDALVVVRAE